MASVLGVAPAFGTLLAQTTPDHAAALASLADPYFYWGGRRRLRYRRSGRHLRLASVGGGWAPQKRGAHAAAAVDTRLKGGYRRRHEVRLLECLVAEHWLSQDGAARQAGQVRQPGT